MVNEMKHTYPAFLAASVVICTAIAQYLIYFYAPVEQTLGYAQKIFYYHLPVAWWAFVSFFFAALFAVLYLLKKEENFNIVSHANAEVGFLLATLTLITGSLWGKHSWGVWWTWDPKLTTALILWFIFAAYLVIRTMPMPREQKNNIAAVIAIIGFLDVPLVFFATRLWRSTLLFFIPKAADLNPPWLTPSFFACFLSPLSGFGLSGTENNNYPKNSNLKH